MTRLRELRLHGFKTFADPTRFVFERGVTAVIGPNGSGKSNMADAVRWVLGEQSNRSLRTRRADDVIFAGSQGRRPLGMAEVVLTLDNTDRWLPIDFAEVAIGRRAYRSGEAEYLINGARARLKEVVELLAGGRLGANELVVVGQGTVDAALSLRPEERRQLFEEAAGVKNLQVRKNEALARLSRASDNLARVGDVIGELKPQVRRLALQAQHQQEHDALGSRARALAIEAHRRREGNARAALGEARRGMASAEAALEEARAQGAAGREAIVSAEQRYWSAEAAARGAAEQREASREQLIRAESAEETAARRMADHEAALARATSELAVIDAALDAESGVVDAEAVMKRDVASEAERSWRSSLVDLQGAEAEVAAAEGALSTARARAGAWRVDLARRDEARSRIVARVERIEGELEAERAATVAAREAAEPAQAALAAAEMSTATTTERAEATRAEAERTEHEGDLLRARSAALAERIGVMQAELETLRERAEGGSRLGPALAAAGWQGLADALDAPPAAWAAIEAVVGGDLHDALVWQDGDLIGHADRARGAVHLLVDGQEQSGNQAGERAAALAAVSATRTLAEWVGGGRSPRAFARAALAPDLPSLLAGWRALPPGWCAVTADGDLADERGLIIVRGRREALAGEGTRQQARRRELANLISGLDTEQRQAAEAAAQAMASSTAARREHDELLRRAAEADRDRAEMQVARDRTASALVRARYLEDALAAELTEARSALPADHAPPPEAIELDALTAAAAAAQGRLDSLAAERDRLRSARQAARAAAEAVDSELAAAPPRRAVLSATREQLLAAVAAERAVLLDMQGQLAAAANVRSMAADAEATATRRRVEADDVRDRLRGELLELERSAGGAATRLPELERQFQAAAIEAQRMDDELVAIGRERDLVVESLPPPAPGIDPAVPEADIDDLMASSVEAIDVELARVRSTLTQIGSVNPFAIDEHREQALRLEALVTQDADLTAAIASTEQLIERLDGEISATFNSAFAAIGAKFDEFCRLLFGGGSASLEMSDPGQPEAAGGIEIAVQPPGKRPQRLTMLSGGERALAGVALLFAMLSVNPVPFCILDEVDAALDEANIGRFAEALRLLAQQIDFVVITHNRATIEMADTIYGVTMTDAAVSRLLSLRLADLPAEVAAG